MEDRYAAPSLDCWTGRVDSSDDYDAFRWHQWIRGLDLRSDNGPACEKQGFAVLGFCCDEGVRRNKGRQGAALGPASIRRELANLPCSFLPEVRLFDAGDILCEDGDLAASQAALAEAVFRLRSWGLFPLVLGGGHEVSLGHYHGHAKFLQQRQATPEIGIINFDAHFDLRPLPEDGSSGTMFRQIAGETLARGRGFNYLCLGIQRSGNTVELFKTADRLGVAYLYASELAGRESHVAEKLEAFIQAHDNLYVTVCADVFSSAVAPGVSAPQSLGLLPEDVLVYLRRILRAGKVMGFDIAEVSPGFDRGSITASLAKALIFTVVDEVCQARGLVR